MNAVGTNRAIALKKGLPFYTGKQCSQCLQHKKRTHDKWCAVCYDLGDLNWQLARAWDHATRAHINALARARYQAKKAHNPALSLYLRTFETVTTKKGTTMATTCPNKATARKAGRKTYSTGIACEECATDKRYVVSGNCVECARISAKAYRKTPAAQEANRERQARFRARQLAKKNGLLDDI